MIEAGPDVPDAEADVLPGIRHPIRFCEIEDLLRMIAAEYRGARAARRLQTQQPFVLRIKVEEQTIIDIKLIDCVWASCGEAQDFIGAIGVGVDEMRVGTASAFVPGLET